MRAGAGYVTALVPRSLNIVFEQRLLEVMSVPLPDHDGRAQPAAADTVLRARAAGRRARPRARARARAARPQRWSASWPRRSAPAAARRRRPQRPRRAPAGPGRAPGADRAHAARRRAGAAARASTARQIAARAGSALARRPRRAEAIVVLKGDDTLVAEPAGRVAVSPGGASALATAGTGDVLSGVTGAFLAKGMDPFTAACAAVLLHARAGQLAAETIGHRGRDRPRRDRRCCPRRRAGELTWRCARWRAINLAAIERNVATCVAGLAPATSCARWSRPTPPAMAPSRSPGRRWPAAPTGLAVATAAGGRRAARRRASTAPILVMGALSAEELPIALAAGPSWSPGAERFLDAAGRGRPGRAGRGCTSSSIPAWGGWARAISSQALDVAEAARRRPGACGWPAP